MLADSISSGSDLLLRGHRFSAKSSVSSRAFIFWMYLSKNERFCCTAFAAKDELDDEEADEDDDEDAKDSENGGTATCLELTIAWTPVVGVGRDEGCWAAVNLIGEGGTDVAADRCVCCDGIELMDEANEDEAV